MKNTICLCGSTRFLDDFHTANMELTKRGFSVITISMVTTKENPTREDEGLKEYLDLVHLNKILRSDAIFIVGDGYIGRSTAREILWARMHDKMIFAQKDFESWDLVWSMMVEHPIIDRARKTLGI